MSNDTIAQRKAHAIEKLTNDRDTAIKRAEAAEARAAQAESEYQKDIENLRHYMALADSLEAERDEARRQLSEAQMAIDVLSKTVVAQNNEIKRLRQQREDVEQYRAEIARLNQAATAPKHIQEALNEGDGVYRP